MWKHLLQDDMYQIKCNIYITGTYRMIVVPFHSLERCLSLTEACMGMVSKLYMMKYTGYRCHMTTSNLDDEACDASDQIKTGQRH